MKRNLIVFVLCLLLVACVQINTQSETQAVQPSPTTSPAEANLPNPASVYCIEQGFRSEIRTAPDGSQSGACIFPDGSECDDWAYYRGECSPGGSGGSLPNPASVYCVEQGYRSEIRTAPDGSQSGACIFPDGSECDEWAYYRGECSPGGTTTPETSGWQTYTNAELGYSFEYPVGADMVISDEPKKSLFISGSGMNGETWGIGHPSDIPEYHLPQDADLYQWLEDHNMLGENRLPDEQIAGTTAVHFRHEASPQSCADDRYYFANDGQLYMLLIGHSGEAEDWELNNRFLNSFKFLPPVENSGTPPAIPTALPIDPAAWQDWATYTHPVYEFTLRLPDGWTAEEVTTGDPLLVGHELIVRPIIDSRGESIRITFRRVGEDTPLWPTGVGHGEFVQGGTLNVAGEPVMRLPLVCPSGDVTEIWYHQSETQPAIPRGDLEFGIIYHAWGHCEPGYSLGGESQQVGETIISSLSVP